MTGVLGGPAVPDLAALPRADGQGAILEITEENDALALTDKHYTQGARLAYVGGDDDLPAWIRKCVPAIPEWGNEVGAQRFGLEFGQEIYTPADVRSRALVRDDRPYAGWLYGGIILQRRGLVSGSGIPILESFGLNLGVIGRDSFAEAAQDWFHHLISERPPQGWRNQLQNEPGLAMRYQRAWRFGARQGADRLAEIIPHAGASLGNVETSFRIGALGRIGWHLPDDFGVQTIHSLAVGDGGRLRSRENPWTGFYVFGGLETSAVLYSEFLDGNLFHDSHSVDREPFVADLKAGVALELERIELALTVVRRTREFAGQHGGDVYGSLLMKYRF